MSLSQAFVSELAASVNVAYTAYANLPWYENDPSGAISMISSLNSSYSNIAPIFVWESEPWWPSYPVWSPSNPEGKPVPSGKAPKDPKQILYGELFGFAATIESLGINVLILRGTVTNYEAGASLWNWDTTTQLALPTPSEGNTYDAYIKSSFWAFYQGDDNLGIPTGLAADIKAAVASVSGQSSYPWYASAHSLGGGMLNLAVVDGLSDQTFTVAPTVVTFGSVVVGDAGWAKLYNSKVPGAVRIANLCDFVPSLRSLLPGNDTTNYQHEGATWAFVWQTDSDWGNHNMESIYGAIVSTPENYNLIYQEASPTQNLAYPVGIVPQPTGKGKGQ